MHILVTRLYNQLEPDIFRKLAAVPAEIHKSLCINEWSATIDIYCFRLSWQSFLEGRIHEYIHYKSVTD